MSGEWQSKKDVDLWTEDSDGNLERGATALAAPGAAWGPTENDWRTCRDRAPIEQTGGNIPARCLAEQAKHLARE